MVGTLEHSPAGEWARDGCTLTAMDMLQVVRALPQLEDLTIRNTLWSGDSMDGLSHRRLKTLVLDTVDAPWTRGNPLVLATVRPRWEKVVLGGVCWNDMFIDKLSNRLLQPSVTIFEVW